MAERFMIDHGVIHDLVRGTHVRSDPSDGYEDGINELLALLNGLSAQLATATERAEKAEVRTRPASVKPCDHAKKRALFATGEDAPGKSLDTISQCQVCGAITHDYAHGGGLTSPNYPVVYESPMTQPFLSVCQQIMSAERDLAAARKDVERLRAMLVGLSAAMVARDACSVCGDSLTLDQMRATCEDGCYPEHPRDLHEEGLDAAEEWERLLVGARALLAETAPKPEGT